MGRSVQIPTGAIKVPLPDARQRTNFSCGCAALHSICAYWGVGLDSEYKYMEELETDPNIGTLPDNIVAFAKARKLWVEARSGMTIENLKALLDEETPVICLVQAYGKKSHYKKKNLTGHYVVAVGYCSKYIYFEDPSMNGCRGFITFKQLDERWHDVDYFGNLYDHYGIAIWSRREPHYPNRAVQID